MALNPSEEKEPVSFRFRKSISEKLTALSEATGRSKTFLAEEALEYYCDLHSWQIEAIQHGLADLEAGRVVSHESVKAKWMRLREDGMDPGG